jgi:hypothetical protein
VLEPGEHDTRAMCFECEALWVGAALVNGGTCFIIAGYISRVTLTVHALPGNLVS